MAEIVDDPLDSGLGGDGEDGPLDRGHHRGLAVRPLAEDGGPGEPGTVLSVSERGPVMMGVIQAGGMVAVPVSVVPKLGLAEELLSEERTHYTLYSLFT